MTAIDTTRYTHFRDAPAGASLYSLFTAFKAWNDARVTRKALASLTDRELDDIGLSRGDIAAFTAGTVRD